MMTRLNLSRLAETHEWIGDTPMRQGRKLGRTIYVGEHIAGMVDDAEFAGHVCSAVNALPKLIAIARAGIALRASLRGTVTTYPEPYSTALAANVIEAFDAAVSESRPVSYPERIQFVEDGGDGHAVGPGSSTGILYVRLDVHQAAIIAECERVRMLAETMCRDEQYAPRKYDIGEAQAAGSAIERAIRRIRRIR